MLFFNLYPQNVCPSLIAFDVHFEQPILRIGAEEKNFEQSYFRNKNEQQRSKLALKVWWTSIIKQILSAPGDMEKITHLLI